ncbi:LysR family transcriptional regulator [Paenibacillus rigui]|uniref:LysR family transcriptional regulator n=1 Tax=Paenibacillus rigui TaxID=554312 RepID=A0A229UXS2_9BACL|nr:LysR family transcriptional regulator [Paenibacillus rigui]OXM88292.1 LysR family transcriptional regulator [Paenibacillus rigui]
MEWQQLEYFRVVAKTEHFTKAAEELVISQPALSRSITKLEEELGVALFDRVGRSVQLNPMGKLFLKRVERALQEIQDGIEEIYQFHDPHAGTVSLAFLMTFGLHILPDLIGKFNRMYPRVEFLLYQNPTTTILAQLLHSEVDLCIVGPLGNQQRSVVWHKLLEEELFIYVPSGHPLADRASVRLEEVAEEPFISFKKGYGMRTLTDEFCRQAGFVPRIKFEGDDVATAAGLVSAGLGITLIPAFTGIDASKIKQLRIAEPRCRREIGLAWIEDRRLSPSAERFRRFIMEQFT